MPVRLLTPSTVEPISVEEAYSYMKVSTSDTSEDADVLQFITAARKIAETKCKRSFVSEAYRITLDEFPSGGIPIPFPPLSTVAGAVTISYINSSGVSCTMASSYIVVDSESEPAMVFPSTSLGDWPDTNDVVNAVSVTYQTSTVAVSANVKQWIKLRVATMYENRQVFIEGRGAELERDYIDGLLDPEALPEL